MANAYYEYYCKYCLCGKCERRFTCEGCDCDICEEGDMEIIACNKFQEAAKDEK